MFPTKFKLNASSFLMNFPKMSNHKKKAKVPELGHLKGLEFWYSDNT